MPKNCMSLMFAPKNPPEPYPDKPLSEATLLELGFVRVRSSSEPNSWGSHALGRAFFAPPSFREIMETVIERQYRAGARDAQERIQRALGL